MGARGGARGEGAAPVVLNFQFFTASLLGGGESVSLRGGSHRYGTNPPV